MSASGTEVVRIWRATASSNNVPAYLMHFSANVEPALRELDGFRGAEVLTRPAGDVVEIVVQTRWASLAAVSAFAGADLDVAVVDPEAAAVLAEYVTFVRHFTVAYRIPATT
jgi:heme-degrading monooxygenase HmoA